MTNTRKMLLTSVAAAALIAGVGVVSAQAPPAPAPAAQQNAPAEKMGPALRETGQASPDTKLDQKASEPKADIKRDKGAQAPAPATKSTTGQAPAQDDKKSKATSSETKSPGKTSSDMKADTKTRADTKEKADDAKAATTGQGATGTAASLSTEQRTTIRTVIKHQNVQPITNVNFSISVGARVPRTVNFYPVPVELVQIYPHWRGYDYVLVGDQIIVVNPRTHEIVAVLDA
jgi:hypothetical protein